VNGTDSLLLRLTVGEPPGTADAVGPAGDAVTVGLLAGDLTDDPAGPAPVPAHPARATAPPAAAPATIVCQRFIITSPRDVNATNFDGGRGQPVASESGADHTRRAGGSGAGPAGRNLPA
jgi:hypothetical protein